MHRVRLGWKAGLLLLAAGQAYGQYDPCLGGGPDCFGEWSRPFNLWAVTPGAQDGDQCMPGLQPYSEIAHVVLISNGPSGTNDKVGAVLFWRAGGERPQQTYIWKPGPGNSVYDYMLNVNPATWCGPPPQVPGGPVGGNVFCSGHSYTGDGRLVCAGADARSCPTIGPDGSNEAWMFDPQALAAIGGGGNPWSPLPTCMTHGRWYPGTVTLPNGNVGVAGGLLTSCNGTENNVYVNTMVELVPSGLTWSWSTITSLPPSPSGPGGDGFRNFPHIRPVTNPAPPFDLFLAGHEGGTGWHGALPANTRPLCDVSWRISSTGAPPTALPPPLPFVSGEPPGISTVRRGEMNSVGVPWNVDQFALIGGFLISNAAPCTTTDTFPMAPAAAISIVNDVTSPQNPLAMWASTTPPVLFSRGYQNTVILPDGTLFVVGGTQNDYHLAGQTLINSRLVPELYVPGVGWLAMSAQAHRRLYHSVATLLPDGSILSMGGDHYSPGSAPPCNPNPPPNGGLLAPTSLLNPAQYSFQSDAEIYYPPYFYHGGRPSITAAPTQITIGAPATFNVNVSVPPGGMLGKLVLIRPGSVTHAVDFDQRYVQLQFSVSEVAMGENGWSVWTCDVTAPVTTNAAQPGYWMLFAVLDTGAPSISKPLLGIPSVAAFVRLL